MKYRKKPVVIEAFRYGHDKLPIWFDKTMICGTKVFIDTLEGRMVGNYGDYIIKGVNGEIYPCKPDIFEKTYERVEDDGK